MTRKLQIFVSSTYRDLLEERQAAVAAILKAGHIPAGMELFTAADKSQWDVIKRWIDDSDAYMLILGGRYGSIEPVSGLSYTELEYDYAIAQGKRLFSVVIKEEEIERRVKERGTDIIEMDNQAKLKSFRSKVLSHMSSFFSSATEVRLAIHESLSEIVADTKLTGWVRAADVPDISALNHEIASLRKERDRLAAQVASTPKIVKAKSDNIGDIMSVIADIEVTVPKTAGVKEEYTTTALQCFYDNKETLINGVTNAIGTSPAETWFYTKLAPKLAVHGLMTNEKVAGARYRRFAVTPLGMELLAEADRRLLSAKKADGKGG